MLRASLLAGLSVGVSAAYSDGIDLHENPGATAPEHFYRGNNLLRGGDYHGAEREFRRAIRLQPWDPAFYVNLGSTLVSQGPHRQSETESVGRAAVAVDPSFARAHFALGQMLLQSKRGHQREGLRRLFRAVALEPRDPELLQGVGRRYCGLQGLMRQLSGSMTQQG